MIRSIRNYLRFAWRYRKVMAQDTDWDYTALIRLLVAKLHSMADAFESGDAFGVDSEKRADEMRAVALLLDNVEECDDPADSQRCVTDAMEIMGESLLGWWD